MIIIMMIMSYDDDQDHHDKDLNDHDYNLDHTRDYCDNKSDHDHVFTHHNMTMKVIVIAIYIFL